MILSYNWEMSLLCQCCWKLQGKNPLRRTGLDWSIICCLLWGLFDTSCRPAVRYEIFSSSGVIDVATVQWAGGVKCPGQLQSVQQSVPGVSWWWRDQLLSLLSFPQSGNTRLSSVTTVISVISVNTQHAQLGDHSEHHQHHTVKDSSGLDWDFVREEVRQTGMFIVVRVREEGLTGGLSPSWHWGRHTTQSGCNQILQISSYDAPNHPPTHQPL